ncbi:Asp23/Gls24 family envelope stress response protein [uncultured Lactobacillus sp.]|uniref:Asp23/Gls24 family envelope stress response protein n=1 Tax=uncultured Lactobacillus sp. TaxID=153152 RepID=UPI002604A6CF|nr:Asp23/Gls24 family envelope stress response protein [uncultured Lactobacillus sp.]
MADSSKILLSGEGNSEQIKIDPSVLEVILGIAAEKVDGVAGMRGSLKSGLNWVLGREDHGKGVNIGVDEDGKLVADIYVYLESGVNVPKVAMTLQKKLKAQLLQMTDLELKAINVHVVGLVFPEDEDETEQATSELFPEDEEEK